MLENAECGESLAHVESGSGQGLLLLLWHVAGSGEAGGPFVVITWRIPVSLMAELGSLDSSTG